MKGVVKSNSLNMLLISLILIISLFSYEKHIYMSNYKTIQFLLSALICCSFVIILAYNKLLISQFLNELKANKALNSLVILLLVSNIVNGFRNYDMNMISIFSVFLFVINIYFLFVLCNLILENKNNYNKFVKLFTFIVTAFGMVSIIIRINGSFLGYRRLYSRIASIYFDPNFMALVLAAAVCININNKSKYSIICNCINIFAIYLSGSRGTVISLIVALLFCFFVIYKGNKLKKGLLMILILISTIILVRSLYNSDYFRISQGSNGRFELISYALEKSLERPIFGYGYSYIGDLLIDAGFGNTSTHNSFVDFLLNYGYCATFAYIFVIIRTIIIAIKEKRNISIICVIVFMIINMNTVLYTFGGVGIGSLLFTLFLGLCMGKRGEKINENKYSSTSI